MFEVEIRCGFQASHSVGFAGKIEPEHWHNWQVKVFLATSSLDENKMVVEFTRIKKFLNNIIREIDGKCINDILVDCNPTAEMLALYLYNRIKSAFKDAFPRLTVSAVALSEEGGIWCWVKS